MKERLDVMLVARGLAESREKAKAIIMSGNVFVNSCREDKAGSMFDEKAVIEVKGNTLKYVSRGGLKLEKAMDNFSVSLSGKICMDVGASTGGFTDCMLQNGAVKVYSVDVGHGQLAWKLRQDERVVCMEKTNIRYVTPEDIPDKIGVTSIDVSFISLTKVLLPVKNLLEDFYELQYYLSRVPCARSTTSQMTSSIISGSKYRSELLSAADSGSETEFTICSRYSIFPSGPLIGEKSRLQTRKPMERA